MTRAFTLIELLVVVTIIVVLLALLVPAMDKAIYQASLAQCAAGNLKVIAGSVNMYAFDSRRAYPYRSGIRHPDTNWQAIQTFAPDPRPTPPPDDRVVLSKYFPINKTLNDPLAGGEVDYENCDLDTFVFSSYGLWFGWKYSTEGRGMFKLGDRFAWAGQTFDILASDHARTYFNGNDYTLSSHPDAEGTLSPLIWQDRDYITGGPAGLKFTLSFWGALSPERGPIDMNTAFADGSVHRYLKVEWNADRSNDMARVNEFKMPNDVNQMWVHLPQAK